MNNLVLLFSTHSKLRDHEKGKNVTFMVLGFCQSANFELLPK